MNSLTLFLLSLTLSTLILLFLGIYARRYRHRKAVTAFAITMLTLVLWSGGLIFELTSSTLAAKLFWANVQFLGITFLPLVWLWMTADYTGWGDRLKWPLRFSAVIPLATNLIIWTNDFHHLFRGQPYLDTISAPFPVLVNDYGPWFFWVHVSSGNLFNLLTISLLIHALIYKKGAYRHQIALLLLSTLLPLLADGLYILDLTPFPYFSLAPVVFSLSGIILAYALFRYQFLDLMPVARDALVEVMADAVFVLDDADRFVDLNPAAWKIIGQSPRQVIGQPISQFLAHRPDLLDAFQNNPSDQQEIQWGAGEEQRYYDTRGVALKKRFGQQTGRLIVLRDITQRKQAEKTLRQANRQLQAEAEKREALIADLDTFAHMVAHDLKNPLAVMLGNITLLEKAVTTDPDLAKQLIRTSDSAGLKMLRMIEELLLLANLRRGTVTPEPVGMAAIIKEAKFRLGSMIQQTSTNIIMPDSWPLAMGYAPWVEEIWANYLSNGMKYGGTPPTLRLGATVLDNGFVRFFVQDNGDGLSPEEQASIFGEFSRLPGRRATGHGLGLSIVKNIVERLGGEVGVESTHMPGEGCIFSFTLPCCKPDDVEEPALALETA